MFLFNKAMTKNEENFEEGVRAINSCFGGGRPNSNIKAIMEDKSCLNLNKEVRIFFEKKKH